MILPDYISIKVPGYILNGIPVNNFLGCFSSSLAMMAPMRVIADPSLG